MTKPTNSISMRIDKWLWCARFFKTRSLSAEAVRSGKIKVNGDKTKPAKSVNLEDNLSIRKGAFKYDITIVEIPKTRQSAAKAALLYKESEESIEIRELLNTQLKSDAALFPKTHGRPTKRDRRKIIKFKSKT